MQFIGVMHVVLDRAILFQDWFWEEPQWFPKSQVTITAEIDAWDEITLKASPWISREKGLIEW